MENTKTLDYYIYEIRHILPNDKQDIDDRLIIRWINLQRAVWLKNEANRLYNKISYLFKQHVKVYLQPYDQSLIPEIPTSFRILRSTTSIPRLLTFKDRDGIISVRNAKILGEKYNYITREQAIYAGSGKLNNKDIFVFTEDNFIYIKLLKDNPKIALLDHLLIELYAENPLEVYSFNNNVRIEDVNFNKIEYPIDDILWTYMKEKVINNGIITVQAEQNEKN